MDVGIVVANHFEVAAEHSVVADVKSNDCCVPGRVGFSQLHEIARGSFLQSNVGFRQMLSEDELKKLV